MPAPQLVPGMALPLSPQTDPPVEHDVAPVRHGLPATGQLIPATHASHVPVAPHTLSCPHDVPGATFIPLSVHEGMEPEQSRAPV